MGGRRRATTKTPKQTNQPGYSLGRQEAEHQTKGNAELLVSSLSSVAIIKYRGIQYMLGKT